MASGYAARSSDDRVFTDAYARFATVAREGAERVSELLVQSIWYDQLFSPDNLVTSEGQPIRVISAGWWNRSEGPDFFRAQIQFGDTLRTGDIEVHLDHASWRQHGHHLDPRYDNVILVVVLEKSGPNALPVTSSGRAIPCLLLGHYVEDGVFDLPELADTAEHAVDGSLGRGYCAAIARAHGPQRVHDFVSQAAEWRMLNKARALRERIDRVGMNQALYEAFLAACGYSRYKHHFRVLAQQLPYDRAIQLARIDGFLVEAAFFQLAGLLPDMLPPGTATVPHFERLRNLRHEHLAGLRTLPLTWKRTGVRPNNYPERRLSGAARFISRTASAGIWPSIEAVWHSDLTPAKRLAAFEKLFPAPLGFWAEHCTWVGQRLSRPAAMLGTARVRAVIGNVFLPAALAYARQHRDRELEERAFSFFHAMPKEPENHIVKAMLPRVFGESPPKRVNFRLQQGLLQVYHDWCEHNPSCRNCPVIGYLDAEGRAKACAASDPAEAQPASR